MTTPFEAVLSVVLTALAAGGLQYSVSQGEDFEIDEIYFSSTGAFSITDFKDSTGWRYSNASPTNPLTSALMQNAANSNNSWRKFTPPMIIKGSTALELSVVDTSNAGNTIRVLLSGRRVTNK